MLLEAKEAELTEGDYTRARRLYESVLLPDRRAHLTVEQRTDALRGRARCAKAEDLMPLAEQYWTEILADVEVAADVRAWAQRELDAWHAASRPSADELARELSAKSREEARQRAELLYQRARVALDGNDFDEAWALALEARGQDPAHPRVAALIEEIKQLARTRAACCRRSWISSGRAPSRSACSYANRSTRRSSRVATPKPAVTWRKPRAG